MPTYYTVKQGDFLSSIAKDNGFTDYRTIWNDPNNATLKQKRQNPNVLYPGDRLYIPDLKQREESCGTDQQHRFQVQTSDLKLRLILENLYEKPIANAKCALIIGADSFPLTSDGHGKIEQPIASDAHDAVLVIRDPQTPFQDTAFNIKIGDLDPVEEVSGQIARLNNLGYFAGDLDQQSAGGQNDQANHDGRGGDGNALGGVSANDAFKSAVEEFQCDHGLTVDGVCGPKTQAKLKQVHGC